tara:strand:+ start:811 stop:966 length:156 start_codon:yes stop_codon:yes gene_type:complete
MPALLLAAIFIYILISFAVGFLLAYPIPGLIVIGLLIIANFIYDLKRGAIK